MSELPPGFILDGAPAPTAGPASQQSAISGPPAGFVLDDAPAQAAQGSGFHWPSLSSVVNGMMNGAQGSVDYLTTPDPSKPTLSGMASQAVGALRGGGELYQQARAGTLDPTSEAAAGRAFEAVALASPMSAGSTAARAGVTAAKAPIEQGAEALGIGLTAGQRTGDPVLLSTENAMLGGGLGEGAQRVAQAGAARQQQQVAAAKEAIGETAGRGLAQIDRPADAGDAVAQALRQTAADARADYKGKYADAFAQEGALDPRFFSGHAPPGNTLPAVPGSVQADFAAPLSKRITDNLVQRDEPVIVDPTLTPAAHRALGVLDNIDNLRLGAIGQPGAADEVLGVNLRGVDQARRQLAAYGRAAATNPSDQRAVSSIVGEFDRQVQDAMERGLFSGSDAALEKLRDARAAFASYQRTFKPQGAGDDVGRALQSIVERDATPEEVASYLYGGTKVGASGRSVRVADRLKTVLGEDSSEWAAVRQGAWQRALGSMDSGPKRSADRILDFVQGDGRSLSTRLFSDEERAEMTKLANVLKAIASRPGTVNPSNSGNRLAGLARQSVAALGAMLGAKTGGPAGAAVGYATGKGVEAISGARNASQARGLFSGQVPLTLAEQVQRAGLGVGTVAAPRIVAPGISSAQGFAVGPSFRLGAYPVRAEDQNDPP